MKRMLNNLKTANNGLKNDEIYLNEGELSIYTVDKKTYSYNLNGALSSLLLEMEKYIVNDTNEISNDTDIYDETESISGGSDDTK